MAAMKIFGIAGYKNSGKTTLVVDLVKEFRNRGLRVATVKHAHHEFDIDHPGKDSFEHRRAGAEEVIVSSAKRVAHMREFHDGEEPPLEELLGRLKSPDVVLVEGYKQGEHPKLELRRAGIEPLEFAGKRDSVVAIVSDENISESAVPVIPRADVAAIADFILENALILR